MTTSKEYLKFKNDNIANLSKLKKQKYNFEPTYYQVIEKDIKENKRDNYLFNALVKKLNQ